MGRYLVKRGSYLVVSLLTPNLTVLVGLATVLVAASPATGQQGQPVPAEEKRLSASAFRAGLKKRGLTELLELHLRQYPPENDASRLILEREIKLAQFADTTLSSQERMAAVAGANRLLEKLIETARADSDRFEWRITLARSLVYDEGEPYFTSILYRGGSRDDRWLLLAVTGRAVRVLTTMREEISREYERIDGLSIAEFENLERKGYVELLDRLAPQCDYLLLWALYYDSLPRSDADPVRAGQLNRIIEMTRENPMLLQTPHDVSKVQIQGLLLVGMTYRLLNDHIAAREQLDRALAVADRLADPAERAEVGWAVTLARMERIRNDCDDGRYDVALRSLTEFRKTIARQVGDGFGLRLVAAMLERSVYQARAEEADKAQRSQDAARYRVAAWKPLARMVKRTPEHRHEIYATLCDLVDPSGDPALLDPFEQCALLAGLLLDAARADEASSPNKLEREALLDRAIGVGEGFLSRASPAEADLVPEVLYNLGVALYRRGRPTEAALRFLEIGRGHPTFERALEAATLAVQIGAEQSAKASGSHQPQARSLYRDALARLITDYPNSDATRYWRFFYAQLLEDDQQYDRAADQYARVHADHERHVESVFLRVRCMALELEKIIAEQPDNRLDIRRRTNDFVSAHRDFVALATSTLASIADPARAATLRHLLAQAVVLFAEVQILPQVDRPTKALATLTDFEQTHVGESDLIGRVLRVRLVAYEKLGRLDEATEAIPAYIASDPLNAGPTLQSLYHAMTADVARFEETGDSLARKRKAEAALVLAGQIYDWAMRSKPPRDPSEQRAVSLQLAEANLRAGQCERARELFAALLGIEAQGAQVERFDDARALMGYAESLYQLELYDEALPLFNHLATALPPTDPHRWQALLRDLQCRTALKHPPSGIIKVIEQQRYLHPELGGPQFVRQFQKLLRQNEKRRAEDQ